MSSEFSDWMARAHNFMQSIRQLGGKLECFEETALPPLSDAKIRSLERELPRPLPKPIRRFLKEGSAGFDYWYCWEPPKRRLPLLHKAFPGESAAYGRALFCPADQLCSFLEDCRNMAEFSWLDDPEFAHEQACWRRCFPFARMFNSDYLALDPIDDAEEPRVVYLAHDDASSPIAESFSSFLAAWAALCYIGPEIWILRVFRDQKTGYIGGQGTKAEALRKLFGVAEELSA
jgi:hypothetical protein